MDEMQLNRLERQYRAAIAEHDYEEAEAIRNWIFEQANDC